MSSLRMTGPPPVRPAYRTATPAAHAPLTRGVTGRQRASGQARTDHERTLAWAGLSAPRRTYTRVAVRAGAGMEHTRVSGHTWRYRAGCSGRPPGRTYTDDGIRVTALAISVASSPARTPAPGVTHAPARNTGG